MKTNHIQTLIFSISIIVFSCVHVFYSHKLSKLGGIDQLIIAVSIYFLIQLRLSWHYLINGLAFVFAAGSTLLLMNFLHNCYTANQLNKYGREVNARVTSVKYRSGPKSYPGIIINFTYTSGGKNYNHSIMDDVEVERRFVVGDTLPIRYSTKDPDLFEEVVK
jgi:hypothetical protein